MPKITINGYPSDFAPGETILQVANRMKDQGKNLEIPQYCYHDGLSIAASCRICLAEVWAPNPRSGQLEPMMGGKLLPTCQTSCSDGMVVYSDSPKAIANQKAVMEYLLINHPLDCPVCDQSGECFLQDYSYQYGRGVSRFEEAKVKQPKKDLGPHVYLYSDRCIMCTRCVRFTREVTETSELLVHGRGNKEEIDVFPGVALDNDLSANVIDLCPVGALLDKDFLFQQRVWFLKETPAIDPITASGDNISIHHNEGKIYRVKPRTNMAVNTWWITDEVRYGWKFVHSEKRLKTPLRRQYGTLVETDHTRAYEVAVEGLRRATAAGKRIALLASPMISCEDAYLLGLLARAIDPRAVLGVGPVPVRGQDKEFTNNVNPPGPTATLTPVQGRKPFRVYAEKAPNARGVRRVLEAIENGASGKGVVKFEDFLRVLGLGSGASDVGAVIITGNYPAEWVTPELVTALGGKFVVAIDTLESALLGTAGVVLPACTFAEKAGTFENARHMLQAFEQAIAPLHASRSEGQIALDMLAELQTEASHPGLRPSDPALALVAARPVAFNAADVRLRMAREVPALGVFTTGVSMPAACVQQEADMALVEL